VIDQYKYHQTQRCQKLSGAIASFQLELSQIRAKNTGLVRVFLGQS
jgi:hypothetical protein